MGVAQIETTIPPAMELVSLTSFFAAARCGRRVFLAGHTGEAPAQHFKGPQGGLTARPQRNQHAGQNHRIGLQLDPIAMVAQQMAAAQDVLIEAKENLDRPAMLKDQRNHVGRQVHQWVATARIPGYDDKEIFPKNRAFSEILTNRKKPRFISAFHRPIASRQATVGWPANRIRTEHRSVEQVLKRLRSARKCICPSSRFSYLTGSRHSTGVSLSERDRAH